MSQSADSHVSATTALRDRIAGLLVGSAAGDALGVPYEFAGHFTGRPQMLGGGLGNYARGEYSDDTQMAVCIAQVSATGVDLTAEASLDAIANNFIGWLSGGATDVGNQTRTILARQQPGSGSAARLRTRSEELHTKTGHTAGNGALMRTAIIGVSSLEDRQQTARTSTAIAMLTHWDPLAVESCILWSEAVRVAVQEAKFDLLGGLDLLPADRQPVWQAWIDEATGADPSSFANNGYTVTALQAAWAAITSTGHVGESEAHLVAGIEAAVHAGNDTDTIAAIAGSLLGACYGRTAIPETWRTQINGWPNLREPDLATLALKTAKLSED